MLVRCQRFGDLFLFGLVWQDSLWFRQNIIKVGLKSWLLTCSSSIKIEINTNEVADHNNFNLSVGLDWRQCTS
jgi:hypothetical protein